MSPSRSALRSATRSALRSATRLALRPVPETSAFVEGLPPPALALRPRLVAGAVALAVAGFVAAWRPPPRPELAGVAVSSSSKPSSSLSSSSLVGPAFLPRPRIGRIDGEESSSTRKLPELADLDFPPTADADTLAPTAALSAAAPASAAATAARSFLLFVGAMRTGGDLLGVRCGRPASTRVSAVSRRRSSGAKKPPRLHRSIAGNTWSEHIIRPPTTKLPASNKLPNNAKWCSSKPAPSAPT